MFTHGETVEVLTAGETVDPYSGEPSESWAAEDVTKVPVGHVLVADGGSTEPLQDARNQVTSDFDLVFPPFAAVVPTTRQRVRVRGLECKVVGRPFTWPWPLGGDAGTIVKTQIVEG